MKSLTQFLMEAKSTLPEFVRNVAWDHDGEVDEDKKLQKDYAAAYEYIMNLDKPAAWLKCQTLLRLLHDGELDKLRQLGKCKDDEGNELDNAIDKMPAKLTEGTLADALNHLAVYYANKLKPKKKFDYYSDTYYNVWTAMRYFSEHWTDKEAEAREQERLKAYPEKFRKWVSMCDNIVWAGAWSYTKPRIAQRDFKGFWEDMLEFDESKLEKGYAEAYELAKMMGEDAPKADVLEMLSKYQDAGNGDPWFHSLKSGTDGRRTVYAATLIEAMLQMGAAKYLGIADWTRIGNLTTDRVKQMVSKK